MLKSKMRLLGMSALVASGLGVSSPAMAANLNLGDWDIQIDNVFSAGASWRVEDRNTNLLPSANGGREDMRAAVDAAGVGDCGTMENPSAYAKTNGTICIDAVAGEDNYDSSINADDGRLNFDSGDIIGGAVKLLTDIEARSGDFSVFVRFNSFYDAALSDDGAFERYAPTDKAKRDLLQNIELLDAYVDWNGDLLGNPLQVRLGKQVINWGESTFYLGGNAVQPSVNVGSLRRPGSEIKEALLPVEAIYASLALPYELTLEAYAGLGHQGYVLDVGGSPFANSDIANEGSGGNGNKAFVGGGYFSGAQRVNCNTVNRLPVANAIMGILDGKNLADCSNGTDSYQHFGTRLKTGEAEKTRLEYGDKYYLTWQGDLESPDGHDYGVALRWYSEALNSTEFGFFYQNYTSQIPYVSTVSKGPAASWTTTGAIGKTGRALAGLGCGDSPASATAGGYFSGNEAANGSETEDLADILIRLNNTTVSDPNGLMDAYRSNAAMNGSLAALKGIAATVDGIDAVADGSALEFQTMICSAHYANIADGGVPAAGLLATGTMAPYFEPLMDIGLSYPDDIDVYGFSFNTTVGTWGVQGEVAYRPDMPLQIDTDELTVGALGGSCSGRSFVALADSLTYGAAGLTNGWGSTDHFNSKGLVSCTDQRQVLEGWIYNESITYDIGTTATYTRSNPLVSALGADLLVLLTELNVVHAPGIEDDYQDGLRTSGGAATGQRGTTPLANLCTSGTDIGLASLFSLDIRANGVCRPTDTASSGLVMLQLQYNNVFGTAWGLTPTFVYQEDFDGFAPSPLAGFKEGNKRQSLSVNANYQSTTLNLSYTLYDGEELYSREDDKDFVSLSIKQGF